MKHDPKIIKALQLSVVAILAGPHELTPAMHKALNAIRELKLQEDKP